MRVMRSNECLKRAQKEMEGKGLEVPYWNTLIKTESNFFFLGGGFSMIVMRSHAF